MGYERLFDDKQQAIDKEGSQIPEPEEEMEKSPAHHRAHLHRPMRAKGDDRRR